MVVGDMRRRRKKCVSFKTVFSPKLGHDVKRCAKWQWLTE